MLDWNQGCVMLLSLYVPIRIPTLEKVSLPFILTVSDRRSTLPHTVNRPIFLLSILQLYECVITVEEHYHSASTRI